MPWRIFDHKSAKGLIKNSFLKFGRREFQWMVLQEVFQKYSCVGPNLKENRDSERNSCLFSAIYKFNEKEDGFFFEGTILNFLLSSDLFWEDSLDHGRELKKAQGFSVPTLSETGRKTILDYWKTEKWAKLQILWNILLKQHSCPETGCLKPQLDNVFSHKNYYPAKDSLEMENVFKIKEKLNGTSKNLYKALILSFLENSIFNLFLRILEQEKKCEEDSVYFEDNSDAIDCVMEKIKYEIRCIKYFGSFTDKSIWVLFLEYFPKKISGMIPSIHFFPSEKRKNDYIGGIFHCVIKATIFWEMFTELYYNEDRSNDTDSKMISKILKQKDGHGNTVLHSLSMVSTSNNVFLCV